MARKGFDVKSATPEHPPAAAARAGVRARQAVRVKQKLPLTPDLLPATRSDGAEAPWSVEVSTDAVRGCGPLLAAQWLTCGAVLADDAVRNRHRADVAWTRKPGRVSMAGSP